MANMDLLMFSSAIKSISTNRDTSKGICVFLGAGADIASGGISFSELKKNCLTYEGVSLPLDFSPTAIDETFDSFFSSVQEEERCLILERLLRETRSLSPSDGYKLLVLMAREKIISSVVTTNFDNLLEEAEREMGIDTFQVFSPGISLPLTYPITHRSQKAIYLKMHGDVDGCLVTHLTRSEISAKEYQDEYKKLLKHLISNNVVIIAGYSGYDEKIAEIFHETADSISAVFWCNPSTPKKDAPLVKVLSSANKLHHLQMSFEESMETIASEVFRDRMIFHSDSVFIWSLIKSKTKILQERYMKQDSLQLNRVTIVREKPLQQFNNFLEQNKYNLFVLSGPQGIGKTTFISQIINRNELNGLFVIPITVPGSLVPDAPTYLMENLGYVTSAPVTVLCQMAEWLHDHNYSVVFALDGIGNGNFRNNHVAKYISSIVELAYILRHISNVKFLISLRDENWEKTLDDLDYNYLREIMWCDKQFSAMSTCQMTPFSKEELFSILEKAHPDRMHYRLFRQLSDELLTLLCEPYFCGLVVKDSAALNNLFSVGKIGLIAIMEQFLAHQNISFSDKKKIQNIASDMLHSNSPCICLEDKRELPTTTQILFLDSDEERVMFRHPLFWTYYLICYYRTNQLVDNTAPSSLKKIAHIFLSDNTDAVIRESLVLYLSSVERNVDKILRFITALFNLCTRDESNIIRVNCMINDILNGLAINCADGVLEWIKYIDSNSEEFKVLSKRIAYSTLYMDDELAYKVLVELRNKCNNPARLECYVLINDRFTKGLLQLNNAVEKKYEEYFDKYGFALNTPNPLISAVQWVWIMGRIGLDNVRDEQYQKIAKIIMQKLVVCPNTIDKRDAVQLKEGFLRNAYMIFFNANSDLEEKYYCFSAKSSLSSTIRDIVSNQNGLTVTQLENIRMCASKFDEAIDFFVCNLLVIESSLQNHSRAKKELNELYKSFNDETSVVELDFYLSALFLSEYISNPKDRQFYLARFKQVVSDYEAILFTSPACNRSASRRQFSNLIDIEFEDGFNALTNYTYTAASINYIGDGKNTQTVDEFLEVYWDLLRILEKTGNFREILRLLQAVSQMIVNWPKEGFEALRKFLPAKHQIIMQALIKILSQNYLRYPQITKDFLNDSSSAFNPVEILAVFGSTDSHIQYRTLEQLQWARIIYFLRTFVDPNIVRKALSIFLNTDTLETALVKIISLMLNPNNGET